MLISEEIVQCAQLATSGKRQPRATRACCFSLQACYSCLAFYILHTKYFGIKKKKKRPPQNQTQQQQKPWTSPQIAFNPVKGRLCWERFRVLWEARVVEHRGLSGAARPTHGRTEHSGVWASGKQEEKWDHDRVLAVARQPFLTYQLEYSRVVFSLLMENIFFSVEALLGPTMWLHGGVKI